MDVTSLGDCPVAAVFILLPASWGMAWMRADDNGTTDAIVVASPAAPPMRI
jgi:hypothetical protein